MSEEFTYYYNSFKNNLNTYNQFENTQKLVSKTQDFNIAADDFRKENVNVVGKFFPLPLQIKFFVVKNVSIKFRTIRELKI